MKFWERSGIAIMSAWGLFAAYEGVGALAYAHNWPAMTISDWGTWVGSIGTVATLAGTIWLATNDRRIRKREERDLALVTIAALVTQLGEIEVYLRVTKERLDNETAIGAISDYRGILHLFKALPTWQPGDLTALVCLERHVAARIAFIGAQVASIKNSFEDAAATPTWNSTVEGSAQFNKLTIPRLGSTSQQMRDVVADAMMFLHSSGLSSSMIPRTSAPIEFRGTLRRP